MQGLLSQSLALSQQQQDESDGDGILSRYGSSHSLRPEQQQQHNASATSSRGQQQGVARGQSTSALPTIAGGGGGGGSRTSVLPRASKRSAPAPADVLITKGRGGATRDLHAQKLSAVEELQALENSRLNVELDLESALRSVFTEIIDRKVNAVTRTASSKQAGDKTWKIDAAAGGLTGLGLSHFSDTDRLSAIAAFLGQPNNFKRIFECLSDELES
jgi:hypothetical protein